MTDSSGPAPPAAAGRSSLAPELAPDDRVRFAASHRPVLPDGDYDLRVTTTLDVQRTVGGAPEAFQYVSTADAVFTVAGPRVALDPTVVHSEFPPARSRGRFGHALAHVVLDRTTLPWERSGAAGEPPPETAAPPWLAVLVFDAGDLVGRTQNLTVADLRSAADTGAPLAPPSPPETSDDASQAVHVLDLPWRTLRPALPGGGEIDWVAHVRDVVRAGHVDGQDPVTETATVISATRPVEGRRNQAHLVSLEGWFRYVDGGLEPWFRFDGTGAYDADRGPADDDVVRLVSLYAWDFFCERDEARSFTDLADGLGAQVDVLRRPPATGPAATAVANGYVALPHQFRHGDRSYSWYHGPLRPGPDAVALDPRTAPRLPTRSADDLLRFDAEARFYDASYAAAWELGRLLAIADPSVGLQLNRWRTGRRHDARRRFQAYHHRDVHHRMAPPPPTPVPAVADWVVASLDRLAAVPFRYLVPDEAMLPRESLRFFEVDTLWIACLRDGAFSIGRTDDGEGWAVDERDLMAAVLPAVPPMGGVLLRSDLVAEYPGLLLDAYAEAAVADGLGEGTGPAPLPPLRIAHLSPRVLLALYEGPVRAVAVHLHPQVMHFELPEAEGEAIGAAGERRLGDAVRDLAPEHAGDLAKRLLGRTPRRAYRRSS